VHQLRKDPILSRWVAVLSESLAPADYPPLHARPAEDSCPLCAGRESETPPEITAVRTDGGAWRARVIPSFRPILSSEGDLGRRGYGIYDAMNSIGANEIIVEAPEHIARPEDMGAEQVKTVIELYKQRVTEIQKDERIRHVLVCKNSGSGAGSGFTHQHSEIIATPIIPLRMKIELDGAKYHYSYKERCIYCDIIDEELRVGKRVIAETERFVAFCPYAPKYPFEFWIAPKVHKCSFEDISPEEIDDLSGVLASTIKRMRTMLGEPSYNYVVHTAPNRIPRRDHRHTLGDDFHWHIEVVPRLQRASGFEWGSGFYVVPTAPEDAAEFYRRDGS
jgi:UDPglucose--hexose-1-phosphate uridylyltransferase